MNTQRCSVHIRKIPKKNLANAAPLRFIKKYSLFAIIFLLLLFACTESKKKQNITLFAAASLVDVLPKAIEAIADSFPNTRFTYNFASSSILARQIIAGAQPDIYISANPDWMAELVKEGVLNAQDPQLFLSNKLVVVLPAKSDLHFTELSDLAHENVRRIAVGDPEHVPAGKYAKSVLIKAGIWHEIQPKIISGMDTRAALVFVELAEVDAGIVYQTDAIASAKVKTAFVLPDSLQPEIRYEIAALPYAHKITNKVLQLLMYSAAVQNDFSEAGFSWIQH
ncbi:MAG: molybdate ABC transporter substrate-binding protein [Deferribacteres bacterium]|nr:molybdate ABC transporter substrate-binding protein [candidate division KSB1 bacterium]MCB9502866.1 molybdate ABC transporter substrate-binding protein [Deferribacteres bacterium]